MPHVDDGTLHALLDGALRAHEPDRADRVEAHLDACADCRARLEAAAALRDRASEVLADLDAGLAADAAADREAAPDFQDVLARAAGPDPTTTTATPAPDGDAGLRRRYAWIRGMAWAATVVVALGTGYLVRDIADPSGVVPRAASTETADRTAQPTAAEDVQADRREVGGDPGADAQQAGQAPETGATQEAGATQQSAPAEEPPELETPAEESDAAAGPQSMTVSEPVATGQAEDAAKAAQTGVREVAPSAAARGEADAVDVAEATEWRATSIEEAEAGAGPLLLLPGATISTAEVAEDGSVRTRQWLPDSVMVVVVQEIVETVEVQEGASIAAGDPVGDAAPAALRDQAGQQQLRLRAVQAMAPSEAVPTLLGLDLDSAAATVDAPVSVTVLRDGRSLTLTASLPEDVLLALAATAAPRTP